MAKIIIQSDNKISEINRTNALQYMADHLTDDELYKLKKLASSEKARKALKNNWQSIKTFLM